MTPSDDKKQNDMQKRASAETRLAHGSQTPPPDRSAEDLLQELQVHQIELQMQNDQLRRAQVALEEARDRYIDLYDFSPVGYVTLTDTCLISEINLTGAALLRVERSRLLHRSFASFVNIGNVDIWNRHFQNALTHDGKVTCELELLRGDGTWFSASLDCLRFKKDDRNVSMRMVVSDITQRRLAEADLLAQSDFFHLIAENVEDYVAVLDLNGRRLYNNPSYARIFGNTESLKGTDSFKDIHPEDRERVRQTFKETIESGTGLRTEFRFLLPNGDIHYLESSGGLTFPRKIVFQEWRNINVTFERKEDEEYSEAGIHTRI